jgi:hypothetical protein
LLTRSFELVGPGNDFAVYWNGDSWFGNYRIKRYLKTALA